MVTKTKTRVKTSTIAIGALAVGLAAAAAVGYSLGSPTKTAQIMNPGCLLSPSVTVDTSAVNNAYSGPNQNFFSFSIKNPCPNDIGIKQLAFEVTKPAYSISQSNIWLQINGNASFRPYTATIYEKKADGSLNMKAPQAKLSSIPPPVFGPTLTNDIADAVIVFTFDDVWNVPKNSTSNFQVTADYTFAKASSAKIGFYRPQITNYDRGTLSVPGQLLTAGAQTLPMLDVSINGVTYHGAFLWTDYSAANHSLTSADFMANLNDKALNASRIITKP